MSAGAVVMRERKPWLAAVLSLLVPGLGHIYCGRPGKGIALLLITLVGTVSAVTVATLGEAGVSLSAVALGLAAEAVGLYAVVDSYLLAKRAGPVYALRPYNRWYVYVAVLLACTITAVVPVMQLVLLHMKTFKMVAERMRPTIAKGDRILVNLQAYCREGPARGDVVVFRNQATEGHVWVQRVAALAGETVEVRGGVVYINGKPLPTAPAASGELAAGAPAGTRVLWECNGDARYRIAVAEERKGLTDFPPATVPQGCVFLLSDNRDHWQDSRSIGPVSVGAVRGKVTYLYWPAEGWSRLGPIK